MLVFLFTFNIEIIKSIKYTRKELCLSSIWQNLINFRSELSQRRKRQEFRFYQTRSYRDRKIYIPYIESFRKWLLLDATFSNIRRI